MKQKEGKQLPQGVTQYFAQPVMVGKDVGTPDLAPLFANHFELMTGNTDIFLDVGIIDPRDMAAMIEAAQKNPGGVPRVKFSVLQRIAMSPATFALLATKMNETMRILRELHGGQTKTQTTTK